MLSALFLQSTALFFKQKVGIFAYKTWFFYHLSEIECNSGENRRHFGGRGRLLKVAHAPDRNRAGTTPKKIKCGAEEARFFAPKN